MAADDVLRQHEHPTRAQIEDGLAGNLCRCGCYYQIVEAVEAVAAGGVAAGSSPEPQPNPAAPSAGRPVSIGDPAPRGGGRGRVDGGQRYVADIHLPDELHVKLVTLPCARGRIISIDSAAALALPGVRLVFSAADLPTPMPRFGPQFTDRPVIAVGETKFHGDPVAAVAAETRDAAEEAAQLVKVEYEELPAVFTVAGALAPDAPLVQDPAIRPNDPLSGSNVLREHRIGWGDVDAQMADLIVEHTYHFPMVTQFAIEPHAFMAAPDDGGVVVYSSIQHPYWLQRLLAGVLGLPLSKVRVIAPDPGGAFGGKQHAKYEPLLAFMALRANRPVRLVLSLEETFQAVRRTETEIRVRTGVTRDGTLLFQDIDADYLIGAFADIADRVVGKGTYVGCGPYNYSAARINARSVLSHTVPSTAFRGFGNPQINWAVESNLTEAALELGIDQVEFRLRNLAGKGDPFIPFDTPCDGDWADSVRRAAELIGWDTPLPEGRGRGFALGIKSGPTTGLSYSMVRLLADGSALVYCGTQDMGQGARTIFAQICANELGLPLEQVSVVMGDTAVVPYDQQTSASRSTVLMGNAVIAACHDVRAKLASRGVDDVCGRAHGARPAGRRDHRPRRGAQGGRPKSSAGRLGGLLRVQCHGRRAVGRRGHRRHHHPSPRDRVRRGQVDQPAAGPDAGRGRGDHGPRPHADGALHLG